MQKRNYEYCKPIDCQFVCEQIYNYASQWINYSSSLVETNARTRLQNFFH